MKVIAIVNQKGGTGKSTTTVNLGAGLIRQGKRVLLVDADTQSNLTQMLGWQDTDNLYPNLSTMLDCVINDKQFPVEDGILHHKEGMDLMPSNLELSGVEMSLALSLYSREANLRTYLNEVKRNYDYILIDCAPSLGLLTINALVAADSVLVPVQAHYLSVKGLEQLLRTVSMVQRKLNNKLYIDGILITMVESRTNFSKDIGQVVRDVYGKKITVFQTEIPRGIKAAEMSASGKSIYAFDPKGKIAAAYAELTKEVISHEKSKQRNEKCSKKYQNEILR